MKAIKLVFFDMDGVIFEGRNFWLELHELFGTVEEGIRLANDHLSSDYNLLAKLVLEGLWKGKPADFYWKLIKDRHYHKGIESVFDFLHKMNIKTAIVSSGPYHLAKSAQDELGIDEIYANRLIFENDLISNSIDIMVPDAQKAEIGMQVIRKLKIEPENSMFIGDSASDIPLANIVGISVAYNSDSEILNEKCTYRLNYGELTKVIDIIKKSNS